MYTNSRQAKEGTQCQVRFAPPGRQDLGDCQRDREGLVWEGADLGVNLPAFVSPELWFREPLVTPWWGE